MTQLHEISPTLFTLSVLASLASWVVVGGLVYALYLVGR